MCRIFVHIVDSEDILNVKLWESVRRNPCHHSYRNAETGFNRELRMA